MNQALKWAVPAFATLLLSACGGVYVPSTPRYPVRAGEQPTPPPPQYPVAPEPSDAPETEAVLPPAPSTEVEAEALPPLRGAEPEVAAEPLPPPPPPPPPPAARPPAQQTTATAVQPGEIYIVQAGDTLSGVGRRFGTPVRTLMMLNGIGETGAIGIGDRLILPEGARDLDPTPMRPDRRLSGQNRNGQPHHRRPSPRRRWPRPQPRHRPQRPGRRAWTKTDFQRRPSWCVAPPVALPGRSVARS